MSCDQYQLLNLKMGMVRIHATTAMSSGGSA